MSNDDKTAQPMDAGAEETSTPMAAMPNERNARALDTLISEVVALFPETTYEVGNRNGRGVALSVTFATHETDGLPALLSLVAGDARVLDVTYDEQEDSVLVHLWNRGRTQDLRDSFNLADAWLVLSDDEADEMPAAGVLYIPEEMSFPEGWVDGVDGPIIMQGGTASETSDDVTDGGGA
jgi:hypothetical protein